MFAAAKPRTTHFIFSSNLCDGHLGAARLEFNKLTNFEFGFLFHTFEFALAKNFVEKKSRRLLLREAVQRAEAQPRPGRHLCSIAAQNISSSVRSGIFRTSVDHVAPTELLISTTANYKYAAPMALR